MKGYSQKLKENLENHAMARIEGVDASYKDLAEVCGRMNNLTAERALELLNEFKEGTRPVLYKTYNKRLGHRKELRGRKGRYPKKAAKIVYDLLRSVIANATVKGLIEPYIIVHLAANKKKNYPRLAPKGKRKVADYETARVEIIIREKDLVKKEKKIEKMLEKKPGENAEKKKTVEKAKEKIEETAKEVKKETKIDKKPEVKDEKPKTEVKKDEVKGEAKPEKKVESKVTEAKKADKDIKKPVRNND